MIILLLYLYEVRREGRQLKLSLCCTLRTLLQLRNSKSLSGELEYQISYHVNYTESLLNIFSSFYPISIVELRYKLDIQTRRTDRCNSPGCFYLVLSVISPDDGLFYLRLNISL